MASSGPRPEMDPGTRPVPKALIWGLAGGFVLFCVILAVIVMRREKLTPEAPPIPSDAAACDRSDPRNACPPLAN